MSQLTIDTPGLTESDILAHLTNRPITVVRGLRRFLFNNCTLPELKVYATSLTTA